MQTLQQITAEGDAVNFKLVLQQQGKVAVWLGSLLSAMAWLRVYFFHGENQSAAQTGLYACTLNPQSSTLNPQPSTLPKP